MLRVVALGLIRFYQLAISPYTPPSCRFTPSCSSYAYTAVQRFGFFRGAWLFLRRFVRCHPFGGEGYDPVPLRPDGAVQVGSEHPSELSPGHRDGAS